MFTDAIMRVGSDQTRRTGHFCRNGESLAGGIGSVKVAILGIADASPYKSGEPSHSANAPNALRVASKAFLGQRNQFDFDIGGRLLATPHDTRGIVDLGDLPTDPADAEGNCARFTQAIRTVLEAGRVPVVLGGDDSVPTPVLRAYEG